jgi:hypothetical protein
MTEQTNLEQLIREPRFGSVEVTYRVWRHHDRLREARYADVAAVRAHGGSVTSYGPVTGDPQAAESEAIVRDWCQGDSFRHEIHGGPQDGVIAVCAAGRWWRWHPDAGVRSNEQDPSVPGTVAGLPFMLNPERLLILAELEVTGRSEVAGRATISARATRLPLTNPSDAEARPFMALYSLGSGAHHYELEIDAERGVLLAVSAIYHGEVIQTITTQEIHFDAVIPADVFTFEPPDGAQMQAA